MKKLLLFGAAALATVGAMAQTDITPKGYNFGEVKALPFCSDWYHPGANFVSTTKGIWEDFEELSKHYNDGLIVVASGGQAQGNFDNYANGVQLIDLGGEVGQVFAFVGSLGAKDSEGNVVGKTPKELLKEYYLPNVDWDKVTVPGGGIAGYTLNFFSDPNNTPVRATGYVKVKITMNVFTADYNANKDAFSQIYFVDNQGNNEIKTDLLSKDAGGKSVNDAQVTENMNVHPDMFTATEEFMGFEVPSTNEYDGTFVWDPTKWMVYEFDVNCLEPDTNGKKATPFRVKFQATGSEATRAMAYFIKDITFTQYDGLPELAAERKISWLTLDPNKEIGGGEEDGINDAVVNKVNDNRIFNLQGIEVSNTNAPGIYIQNGKKFVVK